MPGKDLYRVLNIPASATADEVKKAFRRLAQQYHPDKNSSVLSGERFAEIHEAYQILSDTEKRRAYNYHRYTQQPSRAYNTVHTPEDVLFQTTKLHGEIMSRPAHHIERDLLFFQLTDLLAAADLILSKEEAHSDLIVKIAGNMIACTKFLPYPMAATILLKIKNLSANQPMVELEVIEALRQSRQEFYWNRYKAPVALLLALLLCFFIFLLAR